MTNTDLTAFNRTLLERIETSFQQELIAALANPETWLNRDAIYSEYKQQEGYLHLFTPRHLMHLWVLAKLGKVAHYPQQSDLWPNISGEYMVPLSTPSAANIPEQAQVETVIMVLMGAIEDTLTNRLLGTPVEVLADMHIPPATIFISLGEFMASTGLNLNLWKRSVLITSTKGMSPILQRKDNPIIEAVETLVKKYRTA